MQRQPGRRLNQRTLVATGLILIVIPLTIAAGVAFLDDRKYYFIALLIIAYAVLPFAMVFERRRPQARELVVLSALCAIAVAGRAAFFMLPQIKPVVAVVIITGVTMGPEAGFLVGATTGFVSNFFFGQGPWTPWQMFCFGIIGFLAGLLFQKGKLPKKKLPLTIFGGLSTFFIYGGIINIGAMLMWTAKPTLKALAATYISGIPFDLGHAIATVLFLWLIADPMIEKVDRVKRKYGLVEARDPIQDPPRDPIQDPPREPPGEPPHQYMT